MSQQINLFNPIFLQKKKIFTTVAMGQALAVLLIGTLAVGFYARNSVASLKVDVAASAAQLERKKAQQAQVDVEFAPRTKNQALLTQVARAEADLKALEAAAAVLQRGEYGNTDGYSGYFKALARQAVSGLWLTGVSIAGAGTEIEVRGRALQPELVPAMLGRLARESVMQGKAFESLQINQADLPPADGKPAAPAPYVEFALRSSAADGADK